MSSEELPDASHPIWKIIFYSLLMLGVLHGVSDPSVLLGVGL